MDDPGISVPPTGISGLNRRSLKNMTLGIMQPYFFPYLGYFELISRSDHWIVFDTAQYIRHGWVNRNRILHPTTGWQYIIAPLKQHARETAINQVETQSYDQWQSRILGQLQHYKKKAPGFALASGLVEDCLSYGETNLSRLNVITLRKTCELLDIPFKCQIFSEMNLEHGPVDGPGDWALRISEALHATEYINPPGGLELFDQNAFVRSGVKLIIQDPFEFTYQCRGYQFEPGLSVIDVLMWNQPEDIKAYLTIRKNKSEPQHLQPVNEPKS
jgi:hypothetical protein